jgi:hypothetical protein
MVNSKLRRHKVMEKVIKKLMANNLPPSFKFKDTYDSIELPSGYTLPSQQDIEDEFDTLLEKESEIPKTSFLGDLEIGTSNLFVDTSVSSVGIGTNSPAYKLDVHGTANVGVLTATSISGPLTGNADTATALATARTIGGVSFDGSGNINLPGVNIAGNQNTSGNAATATALATARTIGGVSFDGSGNINLPGVNIAGNQNTSGNAATATALATARTIALTGDVTGSATFDGSGNISIPTTSNTWISSGTNIYYDSGSVGVGTSSPAYKLDVNGTLHAGNSYFDTIYIGGSTSRGLRSVSGQYGTVQTTGGGVGSWEGYSIDGRYVFMSSDNNKCGIYNDLDNEWLIYCYRNSYVKLYYNGAAKLETLNGGVKIHGSLTATGNVTAYSDIRHKKDIVKLENALEKVEKLNGYTYARKDDDDNRCTGVIAQEVLEVLPEAVDTDEKGEYAVAYGNMAGLFIEAFKELNSKLESAMARIKELENTPK